MLLQKIKLFLAWFLTAIIPAACPFERDVSFFGCKFHIPPLCKLNPFYEQLINVRFKALNYLFTQKLCA